MDSLKAGVSVRLDDSTGLGNLCVNDMNGGTEFLYLKYTRPSVPIGSHLFGVCHEPSGRVQSCWPLSSVEDLAEVTGLFSRSYDVVTLW